MGRKRHILVDTLGLIMLVMVHSADIQDRVGARLVLEKLKGCLGSLKLIWVDGGYSVVEGKGPSRPGSPPACADS